MDLRRLRWRLGGPKTAMVAALALPLLPWWATPAVALVLVLTWSWLAFLAVAAGLVTRYPWAAPVLACVGSVVVIAWDTRLNDLTPRGHSLDPIRGRWTAMQLATTRLTWRGRGAGSMRRDLRRWTSRGVAYLPDPLYCEPLAVVYEYGVLGALALALIGAGFLVLVPPTSAWFAVGVTFAVLSLGHAPTHYVTRWAKRQFRRLVPQPPLLADLTIHVCSDGTFRLYREDRAIPLTPYGHALVAAAVLRAGKWIADEHGLTIEDIGLEAAHGGEQELHPAGGGPLRRGEGDGGHPAAVGQPAQAND